MGCADKELIVLTRETEMEISYTSILIGSSKKKVCCRRSTA